MTVFMLIATLYGVLQLAVLGWLTRSVRVGTLLLCVGVGLYGCGVVSLVLQLAYTRGVELVSTQRMAAIVETASYTVDPVIEEVVKVLPLLGMALLYKRVRQQWGLTDYLLMGAGIGAGFTLVEAMLRFSHRTANAIVDSDGNLLLPVGIPPLRVPGIAESLGSWLPSPTGQIPIFASSAQVNDHLVWTALAGFGVGLLIRVKGPARLLGILPIVYACADHMASNFNVANPRATGGLTWLSDLVVGSEQALWLYPLLALAAATFLDLRVLRRAKAATPQVLLSQPGDAPALATFAMVSVPWTALVASRFLLARRGLWYAVADQPPQPLLDAVRSARDAIVSARSGASWQAARQRIRERRARLSGPFVRRHWQALVWLTLATPSLLYLIIGTVPALAGIQRWLSGKAIFPVFAVLSLVGLAWLGWQLLSTVRAVARLARQPGAEATARAGFLLLTGAGALIAGGFSLVLWLQGDGARDRMVHNFHILDALGTALMITGLALALASLIFFPPLALVSVAGGGLVVVGTEAAALSIPALIASGLLGSAGYLLSEAAEESGGGSSSGSSGSAGQSEAAAARARRLDELSRDPAHGNRITQGSAQEGRVGLELEESGRLAGPIKRDPTGGAEFRDANGVDWDVKGFNSNFPARRGGYELNTSMSKISDALRGGENVILDTSKLSPQAIAELRGAVESMPQWAGRILWWP